MPCFKGLAVSIHTPDGPLPEFSIQKQSRQSRIACYIPVPPPKHNSESSRPEQSTFAISITLLTPGALVPYSRPQSTPEDPFPRQKIVGGLPGSSLTRGTFDPVIGPYIPLTPSPNETVAAYIHFDGRTKEEVATLLRRGVETWVNSRWVSVPDSEGGGLAEREFLFREVGLERWLNGLDLEGESKDVAARIERRKQRLEKKRRKRMEARSTASDDEDEDPVTQRTRPAGRHGVLRYGNDKLSPVEQLSGDEETFSSDSDSDDDVPMPEAAGQIKVSLFRVVASGEIKRGEYSPQFDAHDDDEGMQEQNGDSHCDADVDHTTTFAKPKTLDPKTISTQTVTGIDPPDRPYATFTFFYRGEKQLQKMGILPTPEPVEQKHVTTKRKSRQIDFAALAPLKSKGTVGFAGYREPSGASASANNGVKKDANEMDSDQDDDERKPNGIKQDDVDQIEDDSNMAALSAEELAKRGELAEGVKKMQVRIAAPKIWPDKDSSALTTFQLKRQHSFDSSATATARKQPSLEDTKDLTGNASEPSASTTADSGSAATTTATTTTPSLPPTGTPRLSESAELSDLIGSPFKKHRASVAAADLKGSIPRSAAAPSDAAVGLGIQQESASSTPAPAPAAASSVQVTQEATMVDEEL